MHRPRRISRIPFALVQIRASIHGRKPLREDCHPVKIDELLDCLAMLYMFRESRPLDNDAPASLVQKVGVLQAQRKRKPEATITWVVLGNR